MRKVWVVGDVHGHLEVLGRLLRGVGAIDEHHQWCGGDATLVLVGDMVDRGQDGIGVIDLIMRLQSAARDAGGQVVAVLGNHEVQLLAARRFGDRPRSDCGGTFKSEWLRVGGLPSDLDRLEARHVAWLERLPALLRVDDDLVMHADAPLYLSYGRTLPEVNAAFTSVLTSADPSRYQDLMREFVRKRAFQGPEGSQILESMLVRFGAERVVHGHSPIAVVLGQPPASVVEPLVYAGGRCINVDHGLYRGGPGFVFEASEHRLSGSTGAA